MTRAARFCLRWILPSAALAAFLFILNNLAVISGAIAPPAGYLPQYVLRNVDMAGYLNWMEAGRHSWLVPNLGAPWLTPDELFTPILTMMGHLSNALPWSTITDYYVMHFIATVIAAALLIAALQYFLPSRKQRLVAIAVIFCSVPYFSIGFAIAKAFGMSPGLLSLGPIQYAFTTADGLVRGGASNSVTLTFGTATVLAAVLFLGKRIETGDVRWLWAAAAVNFASAFFHPFEFAVITGTGCVVFSLEAYRTGNWPRAVRHSLILICAAVAGLTPYVIQLSRVRWLREMPGVDPGTPMNFSSVLLMWGLPAFLTLYTLLLRFRPRTPKDEVLAVWCVVALLLLFAFRHSPFHLLDGFTYVNAMWLVRVAAVDLQARAVLERNRKPLLAFCSVWLVLCAGAHAATILQMIHDGRSPDPDVLVSAIEAQSERNLREWLRSHATSDEVVIAPGLTSSWLTRVPMHAFAAQDNWLGLAYESQYKDSHSFYDGKWSAETASGFLQRSGIRWVVMPVQSPAKAYFEGRKPSVAFGNLALYYLPENRTRSYQN